MFLKEVAEPN